MHTYFSVITRDVFFCLFSDQYYVMMLIYLVYIVLFQRQNLLSCTMVDCIMIAMCFSKVRIIVQKTAWSTKFQS